MLIFLTYHALGRGSVMISIKGVILRSLAVRSRSVNHISCKRN